jgi:hypothetical protein
MPDPYCIQDRQGVWHATTDGTNPPNNEVTMKAMCGERVDKKTGSTFTQRAPNCHDCQTAWDESQS